MRLRLWYSSCLVIKILIESSVGFLNDIIDFVIMILSKLVYVAFFLVVHLMKLHFIVSDTMVVERYEADQCRLGRSAHISLFAFFCYLIVSLYLTASLVKPDYTHQVSRLQHSGVNMMAFDEVSMLSYLSSIGASITSGSTSGSTKISSNTHDSGYSVFQMDPIVEERSRKSEKCSNASPDSKPNIYTVCSSDDNSSGGDSSNDDSSNDLFSEPFTEYGSKSSSKL